MLTAERLREVVDYDPLTGAFVWRVRPLRPGHEHHDKIWNARFPGKSAGWERKGYRGMCVDNRKYLAHRLAWLYVYGEWPDRDLDHADGDPGNNAIANLRIATISENLQNARLRSTSTSGFKGVSLDKRDGRWCAAIHLNGRKISLGRFATATEAHAAYAAAAKEHFGEFARVA